jgi:hypothetical protein
MTLRQMPMGASSLLELLLGAELVGVAALLLALWVVSRYSCILVRFIVHQVHGG